MSSANDETRLPPQHIEAEKGVLGAILLENRLLAEASAFLRPEDFYRDEHAAAFRAMARLADAGKPVDGVTLHEELERQGYFKGLDGLERLREIADSTPHAANGLHHAAIVRQKATLRALVDASGETLRDCYANQLEASAIVERAEERVFAVGESAAMGETVPVATATGQAWDRYSRRTGEHYSGVPTGIRDLDELTDGMPPGALIVLAARPSMGKTALALQIAEHATLDASTAVLFVSLEMAAIELGERLLIGRAGVDGHRFRTGNDFNPDDFEALSRANDELMSAGRMWIDHTPIRTVGQIAANARRHKARHGIGLLVIDYLTLIEPDPSGSRQASRQEQVGAMSRRLKALAKELNIPVLCLSQLNRQAESRDDRRPRLADLRDSGAVEQDADMVLLLHRPEYYKPDDQPGIAEVIVAKNRNGATGTIKLAFIKSSMRFKQLAFRPDLIPSDLF